MPEGDTLFRAASTLRRALAGRTLERFEAPRLVGRGPEAGVTITDVEARGKHLLVHFDGDPPLSLRTHLKMTGSWHVYRPGERWRRSRHAARVIIEVEDTVAVCFDAPVVEAVRSDRLRTHRELTRLGPDLSRSDADLAEAVRRMDQLDPDTEIGVALLDQRIACGVGNVLRCETLWACGIDPLRTVGDVDVATRRRLVETASRQLRANLTGYPRRTVPGGLAVYGRDGSTCRRCGTPIRLAKQGTTAPRRIYWCPGCQV